MPPNTGSGPLDKVRYSYKGVANPCSDSDTKHACCEECPGTSGSAGTREHEALEPAVDDTMRVTTRAILTYELYKYSKNAMLIINSTINAFESAIKIKELETTFTKFRFEVEVVHIGVDNLELYEKCEQFFQRDFTDYGAVGLVILSAMVACKPLRSGFERKHFDEPTIVNHFKLERNPTLVDKPKIYITEVGRGYYTPLDNYVKALRIDHETHGSVIGFHSRELNNVCVSFKLDERRSRKLVEIGPLMRFCRKLAALGDNTTLSEIIALTKNEDMDYHKEFISREHLSDRIGVVDTLDKSLYFAGVEDN